MNWDGEEVYSGISQNPSQQQKQVAPFETEDYDKQYKEFFRSYMENNQRIYREELLENYQRKLYYVNLYVEHLQIHDHRLSDYLMTCPDKAIVALRNGAKLCVEDSFPASETAFEDIQVIIKSAAMTETKIRDLKSDDICQLVKVPGIIVSTSRPRPKATKVGIKCRSCGSEKVLPLVGAFESVAMPHECDYQPPNPADKCPLRPYVVMPDMSEYLDQQTLKLQELPEEVPTGEMPRNIVLNVSGCLSGKVSPGTRVSVVGISSVFNSTDKSGEMVRSYYLNVLSFERHDEDEMSRLNFSFTPEEEVEFRTMARDPDVRQRIFDSVAPSIHGDYTDDIKKAIACLLVGGSRTILPDGTKLRGDINVLLLGDPSTAKSQFLKFSEKVAPIGVYTSGKGSSAAGLTASVIRGADGEFTLEGGAMVLADGGVVCIDEFDKMREQDRVAIHEAMEQQTISIAKAGITTTLNSRCAVLAAANPVFGTYDDMRSAAENIDFLPTILSRFDLIFIVRDIREAERDRRVASHVIGLHQQNNTKSNPERDLDLDKLRQYVKFCRVKCVPRLTETAAKKLTAEFVRIRSEAKARQQDLTKPTIPITIRQLEAIVRLSEAFAKIELSPNANESHVEEALQLFKRSTLSAANSNL